MNGQGGREGMRVRAERSTMCLLHVCSMMQCACVVSVDADLPVLKFVIVRESQVQQESTRQGGVCRTQELGIVGKVAIFKEL